MKSTISIAVVLCICMFQFWSSNGFSTTTRLRQVSCSRRRRRCEAHYSCVLSPLLATTRYDGYVPDGMTSEEYLKMKQMEAARLKNMNFGAFGPRFRPTTERPSGDWFLMPSLWTNGFTSSSNRRMVTNDGGNDSDEQGTSPSARIVNFFKKYGPAMFLSYMAVDVGITMEAAYRLTEMKPRDIMVMFAKVFVWAKRNNMSLAWYKAHITKCAVSAVLVYPIQKYIDYAKEKWNWSRKRTVFITTAVMFGVSLSWSFFLLVLKKFGVIGA